MTCQDTWDQYNNLYFQGLVNFAETLVRLQMEGEFESCSWTAELEKTEANEGSFHILQYSTVNPAVNCK